MITIIDTPEKFQPVYTDGLFYTISADTTDKYKFRYTYDVYVEDELVFQGKATPNPYDLGVVDVSRIIDTYTNTNVLADYNGTPIYQHITFPFGVPYDNTVINYQVYFGYEYSDTALGPVSGFTGSGTTIGDPAITSGLYKTYYGTYGVNGRATQQDFEIGPFVLSGSPVGTYPTTSGLFLTNSPRIRNIQNTEYYTLGFTNYYLSEDILSQPYYVEYNFYDDQGSLITTDTYMNWLINGGGPIPSGCTDVYQSYYNNVSTGNTDYNILYVGAGPMNIENFPANCAQYTVQLFGNFTGTTSPPSPTATPTPTPSATPGCSTCYTYDIENPSQETYCTVYYTACPSGPSTLIVIPPGQIARVDCACENSFVYECLLNISLVAACQTTTPTPTPTLTNTPTPSCAFKQWVVLECVGGTCSGGICACESSAATTVYTDCTVTNPSNPGTFLYDTSALISPWTGDFQYGGNIYNSTGSDVTYVCTLGGPC